MDQQERQCLGDVDGDIWRAENDVFFFKEKRGLIGFVVIIMRYAVYISVYGVVILGCLSGCLAGFQWIRDK